MTNEEIIERFKGLFPDLPILRVQDPGPHYRWSHYDIYNLDDTCWVCGYEVSTLGTLHDPPDQDFKELASDRSLNVVLEKVAQSILSDKLYDIRMSIWETEDREEQVVREVMEDPIEIPF